MSEETNIPQQQVSVLTEPVQMFEIDKKIKNAQGWLYFVCILQFIAAGVEYAMTDDKTIALIAFGIDAFVAVIYLVLAIFTKKKPFACLLTALIFFICYAILTYIVDPANIGRGIIVKIAVVSILIKGIKAAREAETLRKISGVDTE